MYTSQPDPWFVTQPELPKFYVFGWLKRNEKGNGIHLFYFPIMISWRIREANNKKDSCHMHLYSSWNPTQPYMTPLIWIQQAGKMLLSWRQCNVTGKVSKSDNFSPWNGINTQKGFTIPKTISGLYKVKRNTFFVSKLLIWRQKWVAGVASRIIVVLF